MNNARQSLFPYESSASLIQQDFLDAMSLDGKYNKTLKYALRKFKTGVEYVERRFGTRFDKLAVVDMNSTVHVSRSEDTKEIILVFPKSDMKILCSYFDSANNHDHRYLSNPKVMPHFISPKQSMILLGVEEAYHQHQFRTMYEKYAGTFQPLVDLDNPNPNYFLAPIEQDAEIIVREAAHEMDLF